VTLSDKLFYWAFQNHPDRILELQPDLAQAPGGYRFSAPALKERERRLDGLFRPAQESAQQPVVILEAQMAADTAFLRRLYLESAMLLDQEPGVDHWRVVVICPHRRLNFGRELAVVEFVRERVHWIELEAAAAEPDAPPLLRALALLVEPEEQVPKRSAAIRRQSAGTPEAAGLADVIAAIVITRFNGRSLEELCTMGGITLEDLSQSVAYQEIFGQGRQEGRQEGLQEGRQEGELEIALLLLRRRCGNISSDQESRIRSLPLVQLEALAEALLDFHGAADLELWLAAGG